MSPKISHSVSLPFCPRFPSPRKFSWTGPERNPGQPVNAGGCRGPWGSRGGHVLYIRWWFSWKATFMLLSGPHFVHHTMAVTLRNTKRNKKWTDSGTNFSARKMKGHCSPECDQRNEIGKKGESIWPPLTSRVCFSFFIPPKDLPADITWHCSFGTYQATRFS